jgi:micrococcal nuclease
MRARALVVLLALALASLLALASPSYAPPPAVSTATPAAPGPSPFGPSPYPLPRGEKEPLRGRVVRTVDGDTIQVRLASGVEKVRYIGIDTPEVHHPTRGEEPGGRAATEVNRRLVGNRAVRLEPDVQARDHYGRLLAYVWVTGPDGAEIMVNAELVRLGYAAVLTVPPNVRHAELFRKLAAEAREQHRGLWAP